jgi:spore germination cell wall hydrolase CwlJ-like protein
MSSFKSLAAAGILAFALACGGVSSRADTGSLIAAGSADARAALGESLTALLVAERTGLDAALMAPVAPSAKAAPADEGSDFSADAATAADGAAVPATASGPKRAATPGSDHFDLAWLLAQPAPKRSAELDCLATALYFEARGEGLDGQAAVAEVILNRTGLPGFPGTVCAVVRDGAGDGADGCQFSYACDGRSDVVTDRTSYEVAERIAAAMMAGAPRSLTDGATHFHNDAVRPSWASRFARTARIGDHTFYRMPIRTAQN